MQPPSKLLVVLAACSALALLPLLAFCFVSEHQPVLPAACDEFGYLQLADAFDRGVAFDAHANRPFDRDLIPYLESEGFGPKDFALMVAPHAYHWDAGAGHTVNQYPPATSYLLSWFAKPDRYVAFPPLCALLIVLPLLGVALWRSRATDATDATLSDLAFRLASVLVTAGVCLFVPPLSMGFDTITSIGPTYGLLIAAGLLLRRHPGCALGLLGLTTLFRVGNVVLLLPMLVWFVARGDRTDMRGRVRRGALGGALFGAGGFCLYLIYVWALIGSPLRSTYTRRDTAWSSFDGIAENFAFYFHADAGWMWLHAVLLALLVVASLGDRRAMRWTLMAAALSGLNYAFYLTHRMSISYYPYASAMVMLGMLLDTVDSHPQHGLLRKQLTVGTGFALLFLIPMIRIPTMFARERFADEVRVHQETLSTYDVVWAGLKSGTSEYAADTAGFRYFYGKPPVRLATVRWLRDRGYRQVFWIDEPVFDGDRVIRDLRSAGIEFAEKRTRLGPMIEVLPVGG